MSGQTAHRTQWARLCQPSGSQATENLSFYYLGSRILFCLQLVHWQTPECDVPAREPQSLAAIESRGNNDVIRF